MTVGFSRDAAPQLASWRSSADLGRASAEVVTSVASANAATSQLRR
jgi:hypothetical protein